MLCYTVQKEMLVLRSYILLPSSGKFSSSNSWGWVEKARAAAAKAGSLLWLLCWFSFQKPPRQSLRKNCIYTFLQKLLWVFPKKLKGFFTIYFHFFIGISFSKAFPLAILIIPRRFRSAGNGAFGSASGAAGWCENLKKSLEKLKPGQLLLAPGGWRHNKGLAFDQQGALLVFLVRYCMYIIVNLVFWLLVCSIGLKGTWCVQRMKGFWIVLRQSFRDLTVSSCKG